MALRWPTPAVRQFLQTALHLLLCALIATQAAGEGGGRRRALVDPGLVVRRLFRA